MKLSKHFRINLQAFSKWAYPTRLEEMMELIFTARSRVHLRPAFWTTGNGFTANLPAQSVTTFVVEQ